MIVYGNVEQPSVDSLLPQLVEMLWRKTLGEAQIEQTIQDLQREIEAERTVGERTRGQFRDQGLELMALEQRLDEMEARAIEAEQDRDSWKVAYEALNAEVVEMRARRAEPTEGKRPVDPFGKDGAGRGDYSGLGGTRLSVGD